jgi:hypothetical protein
MIVDLSSHLAELVDKVGETCRDDFLALEMWMLSFFSGFRLAAWSGGSGGSAGCFSHRPGSKDLGRPRETNVFGSSVSRLVNGCVKLAVADIVVGHI